LKPEKIYRELQQHLDRQAVGFPATRSKVELELLQDIFTLDEAALACCLDFRPAPLPLIYTRVRHLVESEEELQQHLDSMLRKGGIERRELEGEQRYCNAPLVVGMWEFQLARLSPERLRRFDAYTSSKNFGLAFLESKLPQMRTIPVNRSIEPEHRVSSFDEVESILAQAHEPFVILPCICREKKAMEGTPCQKTRRKETCLATGSMASHALHISGGRQITRDEAIAIVDKNQKQGLVLQPSNTERADFICACCGCCCGMLRVQKQLPRPLEFWASNYQVRVDPDACDGCGNCVKRCQIDAVHVADSAPPARVDLERCLGCGVCVPTCPTGAMSLVKKPVEVVPPPSREELHEILARSRKGRLGKARLFGKLVFDALRTGRTDILKR